MKLLCSAAVVGLAIAFAVLGVSLPPAESATPTQEEADAASDAAIGRLQREASPELSPAHSDANTAGRTVRLNQRMIDGVTTIVCADDDAIRTELEPAVDAWNDALTRMSFTDSEGNASGPLEYFVPASASDTCASNTEGKDVHVYVRWVVRDGAAYWHDMQKLPLPPRKLFTFNNPRVDSIYHTDEYSIVALSDPGVPRTANRSTIIHEFGHVLGLSDYTNCDDLRVKTGGGAVEDPNPHDAHYSLMFNAPDRFCRPLDQATITDRDLRDLYEAYHVGAMTNVRVQVRKFSAPGERPVAVNDDILSVSLRWHSRFGVSEPNGIAELQHNAERVVVFAHYPENGWSRTPVGEFEIPTTGSPPDHLIVDAPRKSYPDPTVDFRTLWEWPDRFRIVGLTQGDNRWLAGKAGLTGNAANWAFDREFVHTQGTADSSDDVTYTEGDPAYLSGRFVDSSNMAIPNTRSVSASVSPRYCWPGERLTIDHRVFGGVGAVSFLTKNHGDSDFNSGTTAECGLTAGAKSVEAKGQWRGSNNALLAEQELEGLRVYTMARPASSPALSGLTVQDCSGGRARATASWTRVGGVGVVNQWVRWSPQEPVSVSQFLRSHSISCSGISGRVYAHVFALDSRGQGDVITSVPVPTGLTVSSSGSGISFMVTVS